MEEYKIKPIAKIYTDFPEKFGLPRQSGLIDALKGRIVFEPPYRDFAAVKELSEYSHIWVLWLFSRSEREGWYATVRPPRLGGNKRVGVFATRSPYRPNPIGLSAVKLDRVVNDKSLGPVLEVSGIDMADGTPILDIKPYLSFTDSYPNAICGFADRIYGSKLSVKIKFRPNYLNSLNAFLRKIRVLAIITTPREFTASFLVSMRLNSGWSGRF